jgi:hypothetical protein
MWLSLTETKHEVQTSSDTKELLKNPNETLDNVIKDGNPMGYPKYEIPARK